MAKIVTFFALLLLAVGVANAQFGDTDLSEATDEDDPEYVTDEQQRDAGVFLLEGDMEVDLGDGVMLDADSEPSVMFDAVRDRSRTWPDARVPFVLDRKLNAIQRGLMERAFESFHADTCIRFTPRVDEEYYLYVRPVHVGCYSKIGFLGQAKQRISFHAKCFGQFGTILHELMHTLGFFHEQSRNDRDDFVT